MELSGQLHALAALSLTKELPGPIQQKVGWVPDFFCTVWRRENQLSLLGVELVCHNRASNYIDRTAYPLAYSLYRLSRSCCPWHLDLICICIRKASGGYCSVLFWSAAN